MGYRNYSTANGHIVSKDGTGDFTTIGAALTAASSGQTIFIKPGTYSESITLKAGVNLTAFGSDGVTATATQLSNVIILGNCTASTAGTISISGIQLKTNSAPFLTISGSAATVVNLNNCYLNCNNNTGISFTSSGGSNLYCNYCIGNLTTTGIGLYSMTSAGVITFYFCDFENGGASTTASTNSAGTVAFGYTNFPAVITTSSTGIVAGGHCNFGLGALNTAALTTAGTGSANFNLTEFQSGTASCVSVGTGTTVTLSNCTYNSSNANPITGAGTVVLTAPIYTNTSSTLAVNTSTITDLQIGRKATWTPTVAFGGSSTGITYTTQTGFYEKIGQIVFYQGFVTLSNKGAQTGSATIGGLPYAAANDTNIKFMSGSVETNATNTAGATSYYANLNPGNANIVLGNIGAGNDSPLSNAQFTNTTYVFVSGYYWTA